MERSTTPAWLAGLLVVFAVAAATTFSLLIYRHAQLNELIGERARLRVGEPERNAREARLKDLLAEAPQEGFGAPISPADLPAARLREKIKEVEAAERQARIDIDQKLAQNDVMVKASKDLRDRGHQQLVKLMAEAPERRQEVAREEQRLYDMQRDFDTKRRDLEDKIKAMSREVEVVRRQGRDRLTVLDRRIAELQDRVRQLTRQFADSNREMRPDGSILASQAAHGFVVVDRGHAQHLRSGTRFTVFTRRAGRTVEKGQVEIIEVQDRMATARVLAELDGNDPIIAGDLIHNPVFDPDRTVTFAVRGAFRRFSAEEIENMIRSSGAAIGRDLGVDVDFLVAGEDAPEAVDQAVRLGITVLSEVQLLEFIRLPEPLPATGR